MLLLCDEDADCPDTFTCKAVDGEGQCIAVSVLSKDPITLSSPLVVQTPRVSSTDGNNVLRAAFSLSEVPVTVAVSLDDQPLLCGSEVGADGVAFTCTLTIDESLAEGVRPLTLRARDAAANVVTDVEDVVIDRRGPQVLRADFLGTVGDGAPQVGLASTAAFSLIFDEVPRDVAVRLSPGGEACVVDVQTGARATCTVTIGDPAEGPRSLVVDAADDLQNAASTTVEGALVVDVTSPASPATTGGQVVYERIPWGAFDDRRPRFSLEAAAAAVEDNADIAIYADIEGALLLARGRPGTIDLGAVDRARVYVAAIDRAGNRSAVVPVKEQRWVASLGNKVGTRRFENPHQIFETTGLNGRLFAVDTQELSSAAALAPDDDVADNGAVLVASRPTWRLDEERALPDDRKDGCLAFDAARGEVVLFGGLGATALNDTWVLVDGRWRQQSPSTSPSPRHEVACAWDPLRDRVVLVGGTNEANAPLDEVWEWDGATWARAGYTLDTPRTRAAAAFDVARLAVVVVGGTQDDADSDQVTLITAAGASPQGGTRPPARRNASLTTRGDDIVLFGGADQGGTRTDTWVLSASGWQELAVAAPAVDASGAVIVGLGDTVFLQTGASNQTLQLESPDSTAWTSVSTTNPPGPRQGHRAVVVVSGGDADAAIFFGGAFGQRAAATQRLVPNAAGAAFGVVNDSTLPTQPGTQLAFDRVLPAIVAVRASTVFVDDGVAVRSVGSAPPGTLVESTPGDSIGALDRPLVVGDTGAVAAFDGRDFVDAGVAAVVPAGASTRVVRVGGDVVLVNSAETWRLRAGVWTQLLAANPPVTDVAFGLASLGDDVIAVGGASMAILVDDAWVEQPLLGPAPRTNTTMATDLVSGRVLLVGGFDGAFSPLGDAWAWDGSAFVEVTAPGPAARVGHAMTFDGSRIILVGGNAAGVQLDEVWRFNGQGADRPALVARITVGASQVPLAELVDISVTATDDDDGPLAPLVWSLGRFVPFAGVSLADGGAPALLVGDEATLHLAFAADTVGRDAAVVVDDLAVTFLFRSP